MTPYLTDQEIDDICAGLKQPCAMVRYLRSLGLTVKEKPNGRPLVGRAHFEETMGSKVQPAAKPAPPARPNVERFLSVIRPCGVSSTS